MLSLLLSGTARRVTNSFLRPSPGSSTVALSSILFVLLFLELMDITGKRQEFVPRITQCELYLTFTKENVTI
jgi:hypothetical protein